MPKMLSQRDIADTLALGCEQGFFVLRLTRPDKSVRTIWRTRPNDTDLGERDLEVVLPEAIELSDIDGNLLAPGALPGLWLDDGSPIAVVDVVGFFDRRHAVRVPREGYEDVFPVPRAPRHVAEKTIGEAVKAGILWFTVGPSSVFEEDIPQGLLTDSAELHSPPVPIAATAILPQNLAAAWGQETTTAAAILNALSVAQGRPLPWSVMADAISGALRARLPELAPDSGTWPCGWTGATGVRLTVPSAPPPPPPPPPGRRFAEAELEPAELVDFVDGLSAPEFGLRDASHRKNGYSLW